MITNPERIKTSPDERFDFQIYKSHNIHDYQKKAKSIQKQNKRKSEVFLENLKKYLQKQNKKKFDKIVKKELKYLKKQEYLYKDLQNPNYKRLNVYRFNPNYILTRSFNNLTAGQAWNSLSQCWSAFKINYSSNNKEGMKHYALGIQKYLYLLEELPVDFSNIGLQPFKYFLD